MGKAAKKKKDKRSRVVVKELEQEVEKTKADKEMAELKDEELFEITEKPKRDKKRYPLNPLRFKRKMWKFMGKSKHEAKMIEKLRKKLKIKKDQKKVGEPELMDIWSSNTSNTTSKSKGKPECYVLPLPAVVLPHGGQSYNPSASDYKVRRE